MLSDQAVELFGRIRIRGCGFVGAGVALLKVACHYGWALSFQKLIPGPVSLSLPIACGSERKALSYCSSICVLVPKNGYTKCPIEAFPKSSMIETSLFYFSFFNYFRLCLLQAFPLTKVPLLKNRRQ